MKPALQRHRVFLATVAAAVATLLLATPHVLAASSDNAQRLSDRFGFNDAYARNVDRMIEAKRKMPGVFSGRDNKDTEELRAPLIRERLLKSQAEILDVARGLIAENLSDIDVEHLLTNMGPDGRITDAKAEEMKDQIVDFYRDAIFDAITAAAVPAQHEAEKMKASGAPIP